jgi:hypothetical protein
MLKRLSVQSPFRTLMRSWDHKIPYLGIHLDNQLKANAWQKKGKRAESFEDFHFLLQWR